MSARVTYDEVEAILGDTALTSEQIDAFIEAASGFVDELAVLCPKVSEFALAQIEKFLAAHLSTSAGGSVTSATRGDISETYKQGGSGSSDYLDAAAALDPCGFVRERFLGKPRVKLRRGSTYTDEACG